MPHTTTSIYALALGELQGLFFGFGFSFEFSAIGDGPAVLGVGGEPDVGQQRGGVGAEGQLEQDIAEPGPVTSPQFLSQGL
jgi:hypothetical protein